MASGSGDKTPTLSVKGKVKKTPGDGNSAEASIPVLPVKDRTPADSLAKDQDPLRQFLAGFNVYENAEVHHTKQEVVADVHVEAGHDVPPRLPPDRNGKIMSVYLDLRECLYI